jgi:uncharacterized membrane-anchored protein YhcB (DUF1043 family)
MNTPLLVIAAVVAVWTVLTVGLLIGMSVHRERTRRQRRHLLQERLEIERTRTLLDDQRRLLGL